MRGVVVGHGLLDIVELVIVLGFVVVIEDVVM